MKNSSSGWSLKGIAESDETIDSIHGFLLEHFDPRAASFTDSMMELPEQATQSADNLKWIAGARDGAMGRVDDSLHGLQQAEWIYDTLRGLCRRITPAKYADFCSGAICCDIFGIIDQLLVLIAERAELPPERVTAIMKLILATTPHIELAKLAIAILGFCPNLGDQEEVLDLLRFFALHEEFTFYAVHALQQRALESEDLIFEIARKLNGWGRIHCVLGLYQSANPEISSWLLHEGYKNDVLKQYTVWHCAVGGRLLEALQNDNPAVKTLDAAGSILTSLIHAAEYGEFRNIHDYVDAPAALGRFVSLKCQHAPCLETFLTLHCIRDFLSGRSWQDAEFCEHSSLAGLESEIRLQMLAEINAALDCFDASEEIGAVLRSSEADSSQLFQAMRAVALSNVDFWDLIYTRVKQGDLEPHDLFPANTSERRAKVIGFAMDILRVVNGQGTEQLLPGKGYPAHEMGELRMILQELRGPWEELAEFFTACLDSPHSLVHYHALRAMDENEFQDYPEALRRRLVELGINGASEELRIMAAELLDP